MIRRLCAILVATALADLLPEATNLIGKDANPILPGAAADSRQNSLRNR